MVQPQIVKDQLRRIGVNYRFWNGPELRELPKILVEGEEINHVASGHYEGGFAILVSTNLRVLLIDKKPLFLTLEDVRYERITDVELNHRLLDATLRLGALTKNLTFTGYNPGKMRELTSYIQERVMESRQNHQAANQTQLSTSLVPGPSHTPVQPSFIHAHATDEQRTAIGQVAVMSVEEEARPSAYQQLLQVITGSTSASPYELHDPYMKNPYRSHVTFRRRVSRFY